MDFENTVKFMKLLGSKVPLAQSRTGWVIGTCPLGPFRHSGGVSKSHTFACKKEPGDAHTHCFSCGWSGSMSDLVLDLRFRNKAEPKVSLDFATAQDLIDQAIIASDLNLDTPDIEQMIFGVKPGLHEFPDWWLDSFPPVTGHKWALDYLDHGREGCDPVPPAIQAILDLRVDSTQRRVCFPVRDFGGVLRGLHGRAVMPGVDPRYRMYLQAGKNNPIVWLNEDKIDRTKPIVVVEGPFDLASVMRVYRNVTSPLFANPSQDKIKRMADALEWITLFDHGTGGDMGRDRVSKQLGKDHLITHLQPPKGVKDPGMMSTAQLAELLAPHVPLDPIICN